MFNKAKREINSFMEDEQRQRHKLQTSSSTSSRMQREIDAMKLAQETEEKLMQKEAQRFVEEQRRQMIEKAEEARKEAELERQRKVEEELKRLLEKEAEEEEERRRQEQRRLLQEEQERAEKLVKSRREEEAAARRAKDEFEQRQREEQELLKKQIHQERFSKFKDHQTDRQSSDPPIRPARKRQANSLFAMKFEQLSEMAKKQDQMIRDKVEKTKQKSHVKAMKEAIRNSSNRLAKAISKEIMGKSNDKLVAVISKDIEKALATELGKNPVVHPRVRSCSRESLKRRIKGSKEDLHRVQRCRSLQKMSIQPDSLAKKGPRTKKEMQNFLISNVLFDNGIGTSHCSWKRRDLQNVTEEKDNKIEEDLKRRQSRFDEFKSDTEKYLSLFDAKDQGQNNRPDKKEPLLARVPVIGVNKIKDKLLTTQQSQDKVKSNRMKDVAKLDVESVFPEKRSCKDNAAKEAFVPIIIDQDAFNRTMSKFEQYNAEEQQREQRMLELKRRAQKNKEKEAASAIESKKDAVCDIEPSEENDNQEDGSHQSDKDLEQKLKERIRDELVRIKDLERVRREKIAKENKTKNLISEINEEISKIKQSSKTNEDEECPKWVKMVKDFEKKHGSSFRSKVQAAPTESESQTQPQSQSQTKDSKRTFEDTVNELLKLTETKDEKPKSVKTKPLRMTQGREIASLVKDLEESSNFSAKKLAEDARKEINNNLVDNVKKKLIQDTQESSNSSRSDVGFIGKRCADIKYILMKKDKSSTDNKVAPKPTNSKRINLVEVSTGPSIEEELRRKKERNAKRQWSYQSKTQSEVAMVTNDDDDTESEGDVSEDFHDCHNDAEDNDTFFDCDEDDDDDILSDVKEYLEQSEELDTKNEAFQNAVMDYLKLLDSRKTPKTKKKTKPVGFFPKVKQVRDKLCNEVNQESSTSGPMPVGKLNLDQFKVIESKFDDHVTTNKVEPKKIDFGITDSIKRQLERDQSQSEVPKLRNFNKKKVIPVIQNKISPSTNKSTSKKEWKWKQKTAQELLQVPSNQKERSSSPKEPKVYKETSGNLLALERKAEELQKELNKRDEEHQKFLESIKSLDTNSAPRVVPWLDLLSDDSDETTSSESDDENDNTFQRTAKPLSVSGHLEAIKIRFLDGGSGNDQRPRTNQPKAKRLDQSDFLSFYKKEPNPSSVSSLPRVQSSLTSRIKEHIEKKSANETPTLLGPRRAKTREALPFNHSSISSQSNPGPKITAPKRARQDNNENIKSWTAHLASLWNNSKAKPAKEQVAQARPGPNQRSPELQQILEKYSKPLKRRDDDNDMMEDVLSIPSHVLKDDILYNRYMQGQFEQRDESPEDESQARPERRSRQRVRRRVLNGFLGHHDPEVQPEVAGVRRSASCTAMKSYWESQLGQSKKATEGQRSQPRRKLIQKEPTQDNQKLNLVQQFFAKEVTPTKGQYLATFKANTKVSNNKQTHQPIPGKLIADPFTQNEDAKKDRLPLCQAKTGVVGKILNALEAEDPTDEPPKILRSRSVSSMMRFKPMSIIEPRHTPPSRPSPVMSNQKCKELRETLMEQMKRDLGSDDQGDKSSNPGRKIISKVDHIFQQLDQGTMSRDEADDMLSQMEADINNEYVAKMKGRFEANEASNQSVPSFQPQRMRSCSDLAKPFEPSSMSSTDGTSSYVQPQNKGQCQALGNFLLEQWNNTPAPSSLQPPRVNSGMVKSLSATKLFQDQGLEGHSSQFSTEKEPVFTTGHVNKVKESLMSDLENHQTLSTSTPLQRSATIGGFKSLFESESSNDLANRSLQLPHGQSICKQRKESLIKSLESNDDTETSKHFPIQSSVSVSEMKKSFDESGFDSQAAVATNPQVRFNDIQRGASLANIITHMENQSLKSEEGYGLQRDQIQAELEFLRNNRSSIDFATLEEQRAKLSARKEQLQLELDSVRRLRQEMSIDEASQDQSIDQGIQSELKALREKGLVQFGSVQVESVNMQKEGILKELEGLRASSLSQMDKEALKQTLMSGNSTCSQLQAQLSKQEEEIQRELEELKRRGKHAFGDMDATVSSNQEKCLRNEELRRLSDITSSRIDHSIFNKSNASGLSQGLEERQKELEALRGLPKKVFGSEDETHHNGDRECLDAELTRLRNGNKIDHSFFFNQSQGMNDERAQRLEELQRLSLRPKKEYGSEDLAQNDADRACRDDELARLRSGRRIDHSFFFEKSQALSEDQAQRRLELQNLSGVPKKMYGSEDEAAKSAYEAERLRLVSELEAVRSVRKHLALAMPRSKSYVPSKDQKDINFELDELRNSQKLCFDSIGGASGFNQQKQDIASELYCLQGGSGRIHHLQALLDQKETQASEGISRIQQELDMLRTQRIKAFGSENDLHNGFNSERRRLNAELQGIRVQRRKSMFEGQCMTESENLVQTERKRIQLELDALRNIRKGTGLSRINHGDPSKLRKSASSAGISGERSNVDLDENTMEELRVTNSMVKAMFESQAPTYKFGQKLSINQSPSSPQRSSVRRGPKRPNEERAWVLETINKYFDVIDEEDEAEAANAEDDNHNEGVFYPESESDSEDENYDMERFKSTSNIRDLMKNVVSNVSSKVGASKEVIVDQFKEKIGSQVNLG